MPVICPRCNKNNLHLIIKQKFTFTISSISMSDATPEDRVDDEGTKILECSKCSFKGSVKDYNQAKHGILKLFCKDIKEEKL